MISFLAIGDFGRRNILRNEGANIIKSYEKHNPKLNAIFALGDNFYDYGVSSIYDKQWKEWEDDYKPKHPWYAVLGNHDYLSNPMAQVEYGNISHSMWKMPYRYYDKSFYFQDGTEDGVHVFYIDTFTLCPQISKRLTEAMGKFDHHDYKFDEKQWNWLEKSLKQSTMKWKVVVGHYPVFSNGYHGNTHEMITNVLPLLQKYKVDFYVCGHDHDMECQSFRDTTYIVSGAGCSSGKVIPKDQLFFSEPNETGVAFFQFYPTKCEYGFFTNKRIFSKSLIPQTKSVRYLYE